MGSAWQQDAGKQARSVLGPALAPPLWSPCPLPGAPWRWPCSWLCTKVSCPSLTCYSGSPPPGLLGGVSLPRARSSQVRRGAAGGGARSGGGCEELCRSGGPSRAAAGASPGWPGARGPGRCQLPRLCKRRSPAGPPPPAVPGTPTHLSASVPLCARRQGPGGRCPGASSTLSPGPRLPPAASALLLQLLARQGVRLLLPPGHHLGEHSGVSSRGDPGGLLEAGQGVGNL